MGLARIVQVSPPGPTLTLPAAPTDYLRAGGGARWERVAHDRGKTTIRYAGLDEHTVPLTLLLDDQLDVARGHFSRPGSSRSPFRWTDFGEGDVEAACQLLHRWALPVDAADVNSEPPQLQVAWLFGQQIRWVLDGEPEWVRQEFDPITGRRVHATVTLNLLEAEFAVIGLTPVEQAAAEPSTTLPNGPFSRRPSSDDRTHVVGADETLTSIAAALLGDGSRYVEIAALNDLPDPDLIIIGQTLRIPPS